MAVKKELEGQEFVLTCVATGRVTERKREMCSPLHRPQKAQSTKKFTFV